MEGGAPARRPVDECEAIREIGFWAGDVDPKGAKSTLCWIMSGGTPINRGIVRVRNAPTILGLHKDH